MQNLDHFWELSHKETPHPPTPPTPPHPVSYYELWYIGVFSSKALGQTDKQTISWPLPFMRLGQKS